MPDAIGWRQRCSEAQRTVVAARHAAMLIYDESPVEEGAVGGGCVVRMLGRAEVSPSRRRKTVQRHPRLCRRGSAMCVRPARRVWRQVRGVLPNKKNKNMMRQIVAEDGWWERICSEAAAGGSAGGCAVAPA